MKHDYKILLINPPHTAIGSRIPEDHLPPLGLLSIGGPLIDAGFQVKLLDADRSFMTIQEILEETVQYGPHFILIGHSGSNTAHETVLDICNRIKQDHPNAIIIYGGVYPTYHWQSILEAHSEIDYIVRGEGEETIGTLINAIVTDNNVVATRGIAYRNSVGEVCATAPAHMIQNLDDYRVAWELIDFNFYTYWGNKRAVVVQFSRGCPHLCSYCGQRGFWTRWRHRDPIKFAKELAWLHKTHGVEVINFADELPTGSRKAWKAFLEAMIAEDVNLLLVGSTRADDIVRDMDILHLYKKAGVIRFLLGIESYNESTLLQIKKGGSISKDRAAIQLLRAHNIISMATYVVGFEEETDRDYFRSIQHLLSYDPDQIQMLYVTPHRWTPYYNDVMHRRVIQTNTKKWDYKHQVLETKLVPAWRVFLWVKTIEACLQLRPKALYRTFFHNDQKIREAMQWYTKIGRKVFFHETFEFLFQTKHSKAKPALGEFLGPSLMRFEEVLERKKQHN